jgi:hypothetical protein
MSWIGPQYLHRDLGLSPQQRRAVHRDAWKLWARDRKNLLLYLTLPVAYLLAIPFACDVGGAAARLVGAVGWPHMLARAAAPVVLFVVCFLGGGAILQRYRFAPCVYRAARQNGYDVCVRCGYWLKGLGADSTKCPECGADRPETPPPR